jgi:hypothetical protein
VPVTIVSVGQGVDDVIDMRSEKLR